MKGADPADARALQVAEPVASRLQARHMGERQAGVVRLHAVEAAYAASMGWMDSQGPGTVVYYLQGADAHRLETQFLAYRDLRTRGYVVRPNGTGDWSVWQRGTAPPQPPSWTLLCAAEHDPVDLDSLESWVSKTIALVDDDGEVTYYTFTVPRLEGRATLPAQREPPLKAQRMADRALVVPTGGWRDVLKRTADSPAFISFVEAAALQSLGRLEWIDGQGEDAKPGPLATVAAHLWQAGILPRSGFRFGTHLRGYLDDPDTSHAELLVHVAASDDGAPMSWNALSRGVRLAHGVRKRFLVALVDPVRLVECTWFKP